MKEFIDKLIERLEEALEPFSPNCDEHNRGVYNAIEIVNQLAEEYKGGWISCAERLPLTTGYYLVTIKGFNRAMYAWWISTEEKWQHLNSQKEITDVIAWQPLPEPFKPEEK